MHFSCLQKSLFTSLMALSLLSSCDEICDKDNQPQYRFTTGQREWANPYTQGTVWRFRNASGEEQTYLVKTFTDEMIGAGGGKSSFCPNYYHQDVNVQLERTDSTSTHKFEFGLFTASGSQTAGFGAGLTWRSNIFLLPIAEIEEGQTIFNSNSYVASQLLPQLTVGGRTYNNVLTCTISAYYANNTQPVSVRQVWLTKADGLVRFKTVAGTVWDRI